MAFDLVQALRGLKALVQEGLRGQGVRNSVLENANNLNSAILMASSFASIRLNQTIIAKTKAEKIKLLGGLTGKEIESFTRLNEMCGPVQQSANALGHLISRESLHKKMGSSRRLNQLMQTLGRGEAGVQEIFSEFMSKPGELKKMTIKDIDQWVRKSTKELSRISKEASSLQTELAQIL